MMNELEIVEHEWNIVIKYLVALSGFIAVTYLLFSVLDSWTTFESVLVGVVAFLVSTTIAREKLEFRYDIQRAQRMESMKERITKLEERMGQ
jgi:positive regulator of sigma E activity